jgi:hypothetical protein
MIESPFSRNKDILPPAQKELWPELILFSLSRLLRREAASLDLVFGAKAFPTSGGAFLSIEPAVRAPIEAEFVLYLRSPIAQEIFTNPGHHMVMNSCRSSTF